MNKYIEIPLNFLHRSYNKIEEKGYSSKDVAIKLEIDENWYNWREFWLNYQKNPHVLINKEALDWLQSKLGDIEYRINEGMKLYYDYLDDIYDKNEVIKRIIAFIENDDRSYNRIGALYALKLLQLKDIKTFNICENIALSDEDPDVRYKAINVLVENFSDKSTMILKWIVKYDPSEDLFHNLLKDFAEVLPEFNELEKYIEIRLNQERKRNQIVKKIDDEFYGSFRVLIL